MSKDFNSLNSYIGPPGTGGGAVVSYSTVGDAFRTAAESERVQVTWTAVAGKYAAGAYEGQMVGGVLTPCPVFSEMPPGRIDRTIGGSSLWQVRALDASWIVINADDTFTITADETKDDPTNYWEGSIPNLGLYIDIPVPGNPSRFIVEYTAYPEPGAATKGRSFGIALTRYTGAKHGIRMYQNTQQGQQFLSSALYENDVFVISRTSPQIDPLTTKGRMTLAVAPEIDERMQAWLTRDEVGITGDAYTSPGGIGPIYRTDWDTQAVDWMYQLFWRIRNTPGAWTHDIHLVGGSGGAGQRALVHDTIPEFATVELALAGVAIGEQFSIDYPAATDGRFPAGNWTAKKTSATSALPHPPVMPMTSWGTIGGIIKPISALGVTTHLSFSGQYVVITLDQSILATSTSGVGSTEERIVARAASRYELGFYLDYTFTRPEGCTFEVLEYDNTLVAQAYQFAIFSGGITGHATGLYVTQSSRLPSHIYKLSNSTSYIGAGGSLTAGVFNGPVSARPSWVRQTPTALRARYYSDHGDAILYNSANQSYTSAQHGGDWRPLCSIYRFSDFSTEDGDMLTIKGIGNFIEGPVPVPS